MKLAVVGSRDFDDYAYLTEMLKFHPCTEIISGGARGADKLAKQYAAENGIKYKEFPADWNAHPKAAGFIRNTKIANACDELVAFWDNISPGTKHTLMLVEKAGKPFYKYWPPEPDLMEGIGI